MEKPHLIETIPSDIGLGKKFLHILMQKWNKFFFIF